ncbi:MAG: TRIC cation channel family protein [Myxococcaceae bacterium]|nr:TRIC cation channel family protein [Myxococcaceae bacterium]MBH2006033.1 TRIC cation channel family protein [Myxococcaceae bacterium]
MESFNSVIKFDYFYLAFLLAGIIAAAIAGALRAAETKMDYTGAVFLAFLTANGGGTLRDLLLDQPIFWIDNTLFLWIPCFIGLMLFLGRQYVIDTLSHYRLKALLLWADAMGLAIFTIIGVEKSLALGQPKEIAATMGILTAIGGGILSDIISNRPPLVFSTPNHIVVSLFGSLAYLALNSFCKDDLSAIVAAFFMLSLRAFSIRQQLQRSPF